MPAMLFFYLRMRKVVLIVAALCCLISGSLAQTQTIVYQSSDSVIANPERGFYRHCEWKSASGSPLNVKRLRGWRAQGVTQVLNHYYLKDYIASDTIGSAYIALINKNMAAIREAGMKCILRFSYSNDASTQPYDATQDIILKHIAQLKPILQANAGIIEVMQAGFIGVWGEWYYTTHDNTDKAQVIDALLDALPADRQIALRTPGYKITYLGNDTPLGDETAFSGSAQSRIASHNDAILHGAANQGTYRSEAQKEYTSIDTRYTSNGGETNHVVEGYTDSLEEVVRQLSAYHMSYLNRDYNTDVTNSWKTIRTGDADSTLYNKVEKRLGYRLELTSAEMPVKATVGQTARISFKIRNTGWAAPFNKRNVEIVFEDGDGNIAGRAALANVEVRRWFLQNEVYDVTDTIAVPDMPAGEYRLFLNIADPRLADNPLYSIRLANSTANGSDVWQNTTGMNDLDATIRVEPATGIHNTTVDGAHSDGRTYNLQGQQVGDSYKGIIIRNGKKSVNR